jgi:hypothetical protein
VPNLVVYLAKLALPRSLSFEVRIIIILSSSITILQTPTVEEENQKDTKGENRRIEKVWSIREINSQERTP